MPSPTPWSNYFMNGVVEGRGRRGKKRGWRGRGEQKQY